VTENNIILYADDDIDDKAWVTEACKEIDCSFEFYFVDNGRQVIDYLKDHPKKLLPSLIVLDLNMPEMDGRQTLQFIKNHSEYKHIPVCIVTTSASKMDKDICKRLGASLYLTKPDSHAEWQHIIRQLVPFVTEQ
jgi:CheY-like chemotaxis protein